MNNCGKCGKMWQDVFINSSRARRNSPFLMTGNLFFCTHDFSKPSVQSVHLSTFYPAKFFSARQVALIVEYLGEP